MPPHAPPAHDHAHHHPSPPAGWSLLCASGTQRLAGAAVLISILWGAVWWALQ